MARLAEISQIKNIVAVRIIESMDVCKALKYGEKNFMKQPDLDDPSELIYSNIFPYRFIPEINTTMETFITMSLTKFRYVNNSFKSGVLAINVFSHQSLFQTDYGFTRVDFICNQFDELFNQKRGIGLGKLNFLGLDDLYVNDKYQGSSILYELVDFN